MRRGGATTQPTTLSHHPPNVGQPLASRWPSSVYNGALDNDDRGTGSWLVLLVDHLGAAAGLLHLHPVDLRCCALLASHHIHVPPLDAGHMAEDTPV